MGRLDKATFYLSGAIESAADAGVGWRVTFRNLVEKSGLDIKIIDPTRKPGESAEQVAENKALQEALQREGRFEELRRFVHDFRHKDLRFVDISDATVVYVTPSIAQWGTANEVYEAERQHKPIFTVCEGGLRSMPRWLFDVVDTGEVYGTVEEVVSRLAQIDQQDQPLDPRWVLVRQYL